MQADIRRLLIGAPLGLNEDQVVVLEAAVEGRRHIDVDGWLHRHRGPEGPAPWLGPFLAGVGAAAPGGLRKSLTATNGSEESQVVARLAQPI